LYNCGLGDIINVEAWRYGEKGGIVISGGTNDFYLSKSEPISKDSTGWEHLQLNFTVPKNMNGKEIGIYIYNNSADTSYFDDMTISYNKFQ
jgi:hypothetical protein